MIRYNSYLKLEYKNSIYLYYDGLDYAEIRIDRNDGWVYCNYKFWDDFSQTFEYSKSNFDKFIKNWCGDVFDVNVEQVTIPASYSTVKLLLPNKPKYI